MRWDEMGWGCLACRLESLETRSRLQVAGCEWSLPESCYCYCRRRRGRGRGVKKKVKAEGLAPRGDGLFVLSTRVIGAEARPDVVVC